jgi:hypothetical protein
VSNPEKSRPELLDKKMNRVQPNCSFTNDVQISMNGGGTILLVLISICKNPVIN